ncbi:MAG: proline/glycine betaine ABC transporter permease [Desulfobacula sp.]|jgi:glycine betaine/proline transport system permease protein|uniref:ABC transporter permease n=1 Tax=Desulfobacula sp. TaxID=2593537 RepID=UPI001D2E5958|nr:proline/glycine betaine ABC transporter permease [Desulfobacula sp.]MBT3485637.1 proline/glycine betaine ABC transporter permease [Desulfobacula sp.]MBT3805528.1 proline/glycine betaine ABC transporter permease [Desulfobacula sp.]MBT4024809.1 proline/glycine betaine ABC transporter permease [Desulfobacula sp.]MBT4200085.1 proline/glycine betaine ABC transporter permease [Desulfobacula sp.]
MIKFPVRIPLGQWAESIVNWLTENFSTVFDSIKVVVEFLLVQLDSFFVWVPWPVMLIGLTLCGWIVAGKRVGILTAACLFGLGCLDLWVIGMSTLALVTTAVFISVLFGLPIGILAAKSPRFDVILRPILDGMQTIPSFVYLIPAIMFFGIGNVPGIIATVIFALPPMVRLTSLGIQQVDKEVVEAGVAFGCTPVQLLLKIQLPLAIPSIMTGVNQTVMMALSMVVVAAMIGAGGLGSKILYSIQRIDLGVGIEAGLGILFIAVVLDRILQGVTKKQQDAIMHQK